MSGNQDIPADLWSKIEAYQKKGYSAQFDTVLAGCSALQAENAQMVAQIK
jgi:hypothetical protein